MHITLTHRCANSVNWPRHFIAAMLILWLFQGGSIATAEQKCLPAVEATLGVANGITPLPGGGTLPVSALTELQGSMCGLSLGVSSARGSRSFDERVFGSYTYTLGYADFSAGFVHRETKRNSNSGVLRNNFGILSAGLHPARQFDINAQLAGDPESRAWNFRTNGITSLWSSRSLSVYWFLSVEHLTENQQHRITGGTLLASGLRFSRKLNDWFSLYAEIGGAEAWRAQRASPEASGIILFGIKYRRQYYDAAELPHIGIRKH